MKFRFHNNTIRVRLTQPEVACLAAGESIEQSTEFSPTAKMVFVVEPSRSAVEPQVVFDSNRLTIHLPAGRVTQWGKSDEVSIEGSQKIDRVRSLQLLIEKDFQCLHGVDADNEDAFPNPLAT